MTEFFSSNLDPWLYAILVFSVIFGLVGICLYRGKRKAEREKEAEKVRQKNASAQADLRQATTLVTTRQSESKSVVHSQTAGEQEVRRLIDQFCRPEVRRVQAAADQVSKQALAVARRTLSGDHWLLAHALNGRAVYLMDRGHYYEAAALLRPACAIISEWPGEGLKDENIALFNANLKICQEHLGF